MVSGCVVVCQFRQVLQLCGSTEEKISKELVQLEMATEENVLKPLTTILEDDIPSIEKLRRQLDMRTLDMDAAKTRLASLLSSSSETLMSSTVPVPCGAGAPLFPPCPFTSSSFPLFTFSFLSYLFSSFVHPFPFYQNSPTPFPGRRS